MISSRIPSMAAGASVEADAGVEFWIFCRRGAGGFIVIVATR
jgi:hypothetical protein